MDQNPQPAIVAKPASNNGLKIVTIVTSILAICGVGFGIYGMTKGSTTTEKASDFKVEVVDEDGQKSTIESEKITVTDDGKTITISDSATTATKNYVIQSNDSANYLLNSTSYGSGNDGGYYTVRLSVANGEINSCSLFAVESSSVSRFIKDCEKPTGFSGKISQILDAGEGQASFQYTAFIMEDGNVAYIKNDDLVNSALNGTAAQIAGNLKIDGSVIRAEHVTVTPKNAPEEAAGVGAYNTTFFILSDGTYVKFSDSLLN